MVFLSSIEAGLNWIKGHTVCFVLHIMPRGIAAVGVNTVILLLTTIIEGVDYPIRQRCNIRQPDLMIVHIVLDTCKTSSPIFIFFCHLISPN